MLLAEGRLQRMQTSVRSSQPLNRGNCCTVGLDRIDETRTHRAAVQMDRTGAAGAVLATDMRPGQAEILAQEIRQMQSRLDLPLERAAIDRYTNLMSPRHSPSAQEPGVAGGITGPSEAAAVAVRHRRTPEKQRFRQAAVRRQS